MSTQKQTNAWHMSLQPRKELPQLKSTNVIKQLTKLLNKHGH